MVWDIKEEGDSSKLRRAIRYAAGRGGEQAHLVVDKHLQSHALAEVALEWRIAFLEELCHYCPWRTR